MRKNKTKEYGQIYTPSGIVTKMLDFIGYTNGNIIRRHIIDNSCGEGAFLEQIVQRYCSEYVRIYGYEQATYEEFSQSHLQRDLETYVHGIEIDAVSREKCIENLNTVLRNRGLNFKNPTNWDIRLGNTLEMGDFDCKMDYVVGNPPYVRVHNVKDDEKAYECLKGYGFSSEGSSDLYLAFYEKGLAMRNPVGKLCYIAPNSWFTSASGRTMRDYARRCLKVSLIDNYGALKVFDNATTYVAIVLFDSPAEDKRHHVIKYIDEMANESREIRVEDIFDSDGKMHFNNDDEFKKIANYDGERYVQVKNGIATLSDKIFIDDFTELAEKWNTMYCLPICKASTGEWKKCFFPYRKGNFKPYTLEEIEQRNSEISAYINLHEEELRSRSYDGKDKGKPWYLFGRSQGIKDAACEKIAINNLIRDYKDLKIEHVPPYNLCYSGYYIIGWCNRNLSIPEILQTNDFTTYVKNLGKNKSGGYYAFSAKDVEKFINYKISENGKETD